MTLVNNAAQMTRAEFEQQYGDVIKKYFSRNLTTKKSMNSEPRRWYPRLMGVFAIIAGCVVAYLAIGYAVYYWKEYQPHLEEGAIGCLDALRTVEDNYRREHGTYAVDFVKLGVPLGATVTDNTLTWSRGYRFEFASAVRGPSGRAIDYTISARPINYGRNSRRSYLMDRDGNIHYTEENREAQLHDPIISSRR